LFIPDPNPDPDFLLIPDPVVKKAPDPGSGTLVGEGVYGVGTRLRPRTLVSRHQYCELVTRSGNWEKIKKEGERKLLSCSEVFIRKDSFSNLKFSNF
jgi:hypothetical protein